MARAIDNQTILDLIIEAKRTDPETGSFAERLAEYLVKHLPTLTPPNEWVSVEDRLPPDMGDVLGAAFGHERRKGSWRVYTSHGEVVPGGVTHWMPLPEPPDRRPPEGDENA